MRLGLAILNNFSDKDIFSHMILSKHRTELKQKAFSRRSLHSKKGAAKQVMAFSSVWCLGSKKIPTSQGSHYAPSVAVFHQNITLWFFQPYLIVINIVFFL